jgi:hypothetical protein
LGARGGAFDKQSYLPALSMRFALHPIIGSTFLIADILTRLLCGLGPIKTPSAALFKRNSPIGKRRQGTCRSVHRKFNFSANPPRFALPLSQEPIIKNKGQVPSLKPMPRWKYQKMHKLSPHIANCATLPSSHANLRPLNRCHLSPSRSPPHSLFGKNANYST